METLRLNDGTVLNNSSVVLSGDLFLYMNGITLQSAFQQLIESRKTRRIVYTMNNGEKIEYSGYTKLVALRDEGNGLTTAVLRKETR